MIMLKELQGERVSLLALLSSNYGKLIEYKTKTFTSLPASHLYASTRS